MRTTVSVPDTAGRDSDRRPEPSRDSFLLNDGNPSAAVTYDHRAGTWILTVSERGQEQVQAIGDEAVLCNYLCEDARTNAYPYAWQVDPPWIETAQSGVPATRSRWDKHSAYPYFENLWPTGHAHP